MPKAQIPLHLPTNVPKFEKTTNKPMINQNPEQIARDNIDKQLLACCRMIQDKKKFNLAAVLRGSRVALDPKQ